MSYGCWSRSRAKSVIVIHISLEFVTIAKLIQNVSDYHFCRYLILTLLQVDLILLK